MNNQIPERARRSWCRIVRGAGACALAVLLAWGQVPAAAWAEVAGTATASEQSVAAPADTAAAVAGESAGGESAEADAPAAGDSADGTDSSSPGTAATDAADEGSGSSGTGAASDASAATGATPDANDVQESTSAAADDAGADASSQQDAAEDAATENAQDHASAATTGEAADHAVTTEDKEAGATTRADEEISVSAQVIGRNASGDVESWTGSDTMELPADATAADASEQLFKANNLTADYGTGSYGWYLNSITDPADATRVLGWDEATGRYWQLFVNGAPSDYGAGSVNLKPGDQVVWFYSAYGESLPGSGGADDDTDDVATVTATLEVVGQNAAGAQQTWLPRAQLSLPEGSTAADLTEQLFAQYGLTADIYTPETHGYWMLNTLTSPTDSSLTLGYDPTSGSYWTLFINGTYAMVGADGYTLQTGDSITWCYTAGSELPKGDVATNPDADHPNLNAAWSGYANGGAGAVVEGVNTPTGAGTTAWKHSLLSDEERAAAASAAASDPLIINGKLYVVSGSSTYDASNNWTETKALGRLTVVNLATGAAERTVPLARGLDSVCRMAYADGIIVIPLAGGYLQAVSASTLETLWVVDAIDGAQSISTLSISDGYVYVATADSLGSSGGMYGAESGTLRRVSLYTGALAGVTTSDTAGYYWAGGIAAGDYFVIGNDAGEVVVYTADLSQQLSSTKLSAYVHASLVQADGKIYAVTADGTLYQLELSDDGEIREVASCRFAATSTSTPTIVGGRAYVGGATADHTGVLAIIDLATMMVSQSVTTYTGTTGAAAAESLPADVKSTPLVSVQSGGTYVYFTCNSEPGGIVAYRLGDRAAYQLYEPADGDQNYSMSSVLCGPDGTLYYTNDSGNLFAVKAGKTAGDGLGGNGGAGSHGGGNGGAGTSTGAGGGSGTGSGQHGAGGSQLNNDGAGQLTAGGSGGHGTTLGAALHPLGTVSPAFLPLAANAQDNATADGDAQDETATDETLSDAAAATGASVGAAGAADAEAAARAVTGAVTEAAQAGVPRWLPVAGIAVGVCGLAAIGVYLVSTRRRA